MKRTLVAALIVGVAIPALGFKAPEHAALPNFDRRTDNAGAVVNKVAPEQAPIVAELKARVPQLEITRSKVRNAPNFFSSRDSFLTGPNAAGLGVLPATAAGLAPNDPHRAVKAFLNEHAALIGYGAETLDTAQVRREYVSAHNGVRTVIWQQSVQEIPVFDAVTMGHITKNGELVNLYTEFVPNPAQAAARGLKGRTVAGAAQTTTLTAIEAIVIAARNIGDEVAPGLLASRGAAQGAARKEVFRGAGPLNGDQYAELVWLPLNGNTLRLCWQVIVISKTRGEGFLMVIDSETGEVVLRRCLTHYISNATYNVYTSDSPSPFSPGHPTPQIGQPPIVPRQLITTPALNTNASPNGWIDDGVNETRGNNVDAHSDRNDDDDPDLPRPQGNNRVFDFPLDLSQDPTNYTAAAIVNLFYWNNVMHDRLYELGFTEAAGNFQLNNLGRGGIGNDPVFAQAQDGGGFNNANMLTLPDGFPARMQMYLLDGPNPRRDGDLDQEVILHEYTHGLSNRRVGGGIGISQLQSAGMGEGWGDFYGLSILSEASDDIGGVWAPAGYFAFQFFGFPFEENYYFGDRRYPYSTNLQKNPLTFKDIDPNQISPHAGIPRNPIFGAFTPFDAAEVHNQGEVWCVTLWEMRANLINKHGFAIGNQLAMQLVTDAMSLCPPNPNFLQSRDAILLADRLNNANANYNEIWRAFAKRGMGSSATSPDSSTTQGIVESFDFPGLSLGAIAVLDSSTGNANGAIDPNECIELFVDLRNNSVAPAVSVSGVLTTTTPGVTIVQGFSAYPDLPPNVAGQNLTPFRIYTTPDFICGTRIELALIGTAFAPDRQVTTNAFQIRSGFVSLNPVLLNNNTPVPIPDANTNGAQSAINVSGMSGALGKVTVSLHLTHSAVGDLVVELIGPDGTTIALVKNQGADGDNFGTSCTPFSARTTFDDHAPFPISVGNAPYVGTFRPDEPLDVFEGKSGAAVNGTWRLRVIDVGSQDVGTLQCWTLALHPTVCTDGGGPCTSDVGVSGSASPSPALSNTDLTYTIAVTNHRPIAATAVVLTNLLPANVAFVSASSPQGSCSFSNGTVQCNFGILSNGVNAIATIVVKPTLAGSLTNAFAVTSAGADANLANNLASIVTSVTSPLPIIVAGGAGIVAEQGTATGGIESGETVTVNLALRNTGSAATANLIATLQDGNGVVGSGGASRNYGVIGVGATVSQPFTFTASGAAGSTVSALLHLQDGVQNLGTVAFNFVLGGESIFESGASITINALGAASPYPATINISGLGGVVSKVRVTLSKLTHSFPDDIDAMLVGPRGQKLVLMSDSGGGNAIVNRTLTFDASASGTLPDEGVIAAGTYLPTDYVSGTEPAGDVFPAPAPAGSFASSLLAFNSTDPNGTWSLYIHDDGGGDGGAVSGGWALAIGTAVPLSSAANLSIVAGTSPSPAIVGEPLTYTLTVANAGPSNATSVVVSDIIPANSSFLSASSSQGTTSFAAGVLTANLGTINSGAFATVTVRVTPTSPGLVSNQASVSAATADLDQSNNSVTTIVSANTGVADVAVQAVAAPLPAFVSSNVTFTATITNRGPNQAQGVQLVTTLSSATTVVSATNSQGGCSSVGGIVTCDVGALPVNGSARVVIVATALNAVTATNVLAVSATTTDLAPANNTTNVVIAINPLAPLIVTAGAALTAESLVPANNAIEPGETVTLNFALRNAGTAPVTDLVATLLASGGVTSPSGPQIYGGLAAQGASVSRPFTFVASGSAGDTLTATLQLQDGAQSLGTVSFAFTLSANYPITSGNPILVPNQGAAATYPSSVDVSGLTGAISKVTVTLNQLTHSFPDDLDIVLVGPAGQKVLLLSDVGGGVAVTDVNVTFDDGALTGAPGPLVSGVYRPTDLVGADGDNLPAPAPGKPYASTLAVFTGTNPNGTWSLYVADDTAGDSGRINSWTLNVQTATPVVPSADVSVAVAAPATVQPGASMNYVITIANSGPGTASGIVMTDPLPAGFTVNAINVSQGNFSTAGGVVTANVGSLASGGIATVTLTGVASTPGFLTNAVAVVSALADLNLANNSSVAVTDVGSLRLGISRVGEDVVISWPAPSSGYVLETSVSAAGPWEPSSATVIVTNGENRATIAASGTAFYRLRKP